MAAAARSLAGLDAERTLVGGQRFQLELILLARTREGSARTAPGRPAAGARGRS